MTPEELWLLSVSSQQCAPLSGLGTADEWAVMSALEVVLRLAEAMLC